MSNSIPGAEGILQRQVLARLEAAGAAGVGEGELRQQIGGDAEELTRTLARLESKGLAVEMEGRRYAPAATGWTVGVVERLEEGDALIVCPVSQARTPRTTSRSGT